ncbi:LPS export ABC transporter ATP-binding protein [Candidatus Aminicenantes bacterium AC-334-K16]|jgi:lipopolysaccharide export system ATP-binding protein|nr:LPS export ABC transporter ATP-binding protein [Candidatus Aminicenantes bacterium AC-334-K16]
MATLKAKNLYKRFGKRLVVKNITLSLESGKIYGLLGRNGAGKTTTFQIITGLLKPDSGQIYLDDNDISSMPTHERAHSGISYLPQESSAFLKTSVLNNLLIVLREMGLSSKDAKEKALSLLEELGLTRLATQPAYTLSGGERRRLEICRALTLNPKFLLLDEPFTGIDPLTIDELQDIFLRLKNKGIGLLLSDHNVKDTFQIADHVFIIDEGEMLVEGPPLEVAQNKLARQRFLGENFRFGEERVYSSAEGKS